ncbi:hypothetical protein BH24BAC1_BH24BAC1_34500 [soil metagenome]
MILLQGTTPEPKKLSALIKGINGALSAGLDSLDEDLKKHETTLESIYTLLIEAQKSGKLVFVATPQLQGLQGLAGLPGLGCLGTPEKDCGCKARTLGVIPVKKSPPLSETGSQA